MVDITAAILALKRRLDIKPTDLDYDPLLQDLIEAAVRRLYPRVGYEVDAQEVSVAADSYGEATISLSTVGIGFARSVEAYDGQTWFPISDTYHHGSYLRLRGLNSSITAVRVYGVNRFDSVSDVLPEFLQAVYWYAMAEFWDYLTSDKKLYNIYAQNIAARGVDNMQDVSAYYDQKADNYLDEQRQVYA